MSDLQKEFDSDSLSRTVPLVDAQWQACNICLEELCQTDLKTHESCDDCVLCDTCIEVCILFLKCIVFYYYSKKKLEITGIFVWSL